MAQPGNFTPILLYGSSTPSNVPLAANLTNSATGSEIAINVADKNLFFKDSGGTVNTVPIRQSSTSSNGWLSSTDWNTFNGKQAALVSGTNIKTVGGVTLLGSGDVGTIGIGYGGTGQTSFTAGQIHYGSFSTSANLAYSTDLSLTGGNYLCSAGKGIAYIADATRIFTPEDNVSGGLLQWGAGGILRFKSGAATDVARFDSSGNFLVGTTSASISERLSVYQPNNAAGIFIQPTNASFSGTAIYTNTTRAASSAFDLIGSYANSVGQFMVRGDGVIFAQNIIVQSISDIRLKENIIDSKDGLDVITALRPVRYDWKPGYGNDRKNQLGFIAQEIELVFPEAVDKWQVNKDDDTVYKTVGPSALIPVLVKALQELNDKFDAYVASHP